MSFKNTDLFLKNFPLPKGWSLQQSPNKGYQLQLEKNSSFYLDFSLTKNLSSQQSLAKAIGFKNQKLSVLDITAGWAKDAFLMASLGCHVTAIESHPFVFHFVESELKKHNISRTLKFLLADSVSYLKSLNNPEDYPDVIFMDPMFEGRKKSLSKKALRILQELVGDTKSKHILFKWALLKAKQRVVVKRHKLDIALSKNLLCSIKGRSVYYDVFQPKGEKFEITK